jgi:ribosomal protein S18 acetylase RimI-like enzyme
VCNSKENFIAEVFDLAVLSWEDIKETVISIEREAFGDKSFSDDDLSKDFQDKRNTVVLLKQAGSNTIIGFTYAKPTEEIDPSEEIRPEKEVAFIWDTVIRKSFRHKHLVGILMNSLEEELRKRGYKYFEREAAVANNYAANISKQYKGRILEQSEPHDSVYGSQVFFRIRL